VTFGVTVEAAVEPPACPFAKPGMDPARRKVDLAETIDRAVKEHVKHVLTEARRNVDFAETIDRAVKELLGLITEEAKPGAAAEAPGRETPDTFDLITNSAASESLVAGPTSTDTIPILPEVSVGESAQPGPTHAFNMPEVQAYDAAESDSSTSSSSGPLGSPFPAHDNMPFQTTARHRSDSLELDSITDSSSKVYAHQGTVTQTKGQSELDNITDSSSKVRTPQRSATATIIPVRQNSFRDFVTKAARTRSDSSELNNITDSSSKVRTPQRSFTNSATATAIPEKKVVSLTEVDQHSPTQAEHSSHAEVNILSLREIRASSEHDKRTVAVAERYCPLWERLVLDAIPRIADMRMGDRTRARPRCMLSPDGYARIHWDLFCLLIIGIEAFFVPLSFAFSDVTVQEEWGWFVVVFFASDIVLNFFTGFQYRGITVLSLQLSAAKYMTSAWIWVDIVSTVPWDSVGSGGGEGSAVANGDGDDGAPSGAARLIRILRIGKLMRLVKLRTIVPRIESALRQNHNLFVCFKLSKFLVVLLVFAHLIACCWGALGEMDWNPDVEFHAPWMQHTVSEGGVFVSDLALSRRYVLSLAWSSAVLLQGAYAPPYNPGTLGEHVFLAFANLFSFYICALFVGSLVAMLDDLYKSKRKLKEDQSTLENFMIKRNIPSVLQARAVHDLMGRSKIEVIGDDGAVEKVLDKLDPLTRQKIRQELYMGVVQLHPFFTEMSLAALRQLCDQVDVMHAQRGEYIVRRGEVASSMFFIVSGQLVAQRNPDNLKEEDAQLNPPSFFGAQCIFKEGQRTRNVIALTKAELVQVSTSAIYAVGKEHAEVGVALRLRLQEAASSGVLCAHCGFAHEISVCPSLRREAGKGKDAPQVARGGRMWAASKLKSTLRLNKNSSTLRSLEPLRRTATVDSGGSGNKSRGSWSKVLGRASSDKEVSITPTSQSPSVSVTREKMSFSRHSEQAERSPHQSPRSSEEDDEVLSPLSPLIQIQAGTKTF
jgi:hypothetical protein